MTRGLNIWSAFCLAVWAWLAVSTSSAQDTKRVVVMDFSGPGSGAVRGHVVAALSDRSEVYLVSSREAENAANRLGISLESGADYQKLAADLKVSAFIEGNVTREGGAVRALIRVRNAATGEVVHEEPWRRKKPAQLKAIRGNFWEAMGPHILASSVPEQDEAPAPTPVAQQEEEPAASGFESEQARDEEPAPAAGAEQYVRPALLAWGGPRLMWRSLSYDGDSTLSTYKNDGGSPAFNLALGAQWYPAAQVSRGFASNLGLEGEIDYSIGLKSKQGGKSVSTTAYELAGGAIVRIPLDSFEPRLRVGYVKHVFDAKVPTGTPLPTASYSAVRLGLGTAINLVEWLALDVSLGYLVVLDAGEIQTSKFASKLSASAFELGGGALLRFGGPFGMRFAVDYRRYSYDFGSSMSPSYVLPEKGSDSYLRTTLAFVFMLPSVGASATAN